MEVISAIKWPLFELIVSAVGLASSQQYYLFTLLLSKALNQLIMNYYMVSGSNHISIT